MQSEVRSAWCGVYKITAPSGKFYIGSSTNCRKRWTAHRGNLRHGRYDPSPLYSAWRKYGEDQLRFSMLIVCRRSELLFYEQRALDIIKPAYNLCQTAGTRASVKWTAEQRAIIKERRSTPEAREKYRQAALKRSPISEEHKAKLIAILKSPENVARTIAANVGRRLSVEHRLKLSLARMGNKNNLGRKASAETRAKMSAARTGKPKPKGIKFSAEARARLSKARYADHARRKAKRLVDQLDLGL